MGAREPGGVDLRVMRCDTFVVLGPGRDLRQGDTVVQVRLTVAEVASLPPAIRERWQAAIVGGRGALPAAKRRLTVTDAVDVLRDAVRALVVCLLLVLLAVPAWADGPRWVDPCAVNPELCMGDERGLSERWADRGLPLPESDDLIFRWERDDVSTIDEDDDEDEDW